VHALEYDLYGSVLAGKLNRVGQKIPYDLLKPVGIAGNGTRRWIEDLLQSNPFSLSGRTHGFHGRFNESHGVKGLDIKADFAGSNPAHVEQIFYELSLCSRIPLD